MKLEKFKKNNKYKKVFLTLGIAVGCLGGGIILSKSYALYETKQEYNVIKGTVPDFRSDVTLALTVDGVKTDTIPTKDSGNYAIQVNCDKGVGLWKMDTWGVEINQIEENKVKCDISFTTLKNNEVFEFDYKGKEETISLSSGRYKLEVWGAQGGNCGGAKAGYGGYSVGEITLDSNTLLYINVGGKGENNHSNEISYGGYNGGGNGNNTKQMGTGGGGATHIAKVSGLLSTLENNIDDILIVAGGGGGNGNYQDSLGGSGGGISGTNGVNKDTTSNTTNYTGKGGTQSTGGKYYTTVSDEATSGKFGQGGNNYDELASCDNIGCGGSGGGGGFYGGGGSGRGHAGAGGGSGYIGNSLLKNKSMYCYECEASEIVETKTVSIETTNEQAISQTAKSGNGYAKITYLGNN